MGVEFDSRLFMGRDVFAETDPLVIFNDRSFITDKGRYDSVAREFTPEEGVEVPGDYQQLISEEIDRKFYYSAQILDRDYYALRRRPIEPLKVFEGYRVQEIRLFRLGRAGVS